MKNRISNTKIGFRNTVAILIFIFGLMISGYIGISAMFVCPIMEFVFRCYAHALTVSFVIFAVIKVFLSPIVGGYIILFSYKLAKSISITE